MAAKTSWLGRALWIAICSLGVSKAFAQPTDFQWTFTNNGFVAWTLTSVSSPKVFAGALPADNPTINLILGKHYGVTDIPFSVHPFQVIAKGPSSVSDVILLSVGPTVGSFESDPAVAWTDDGSGHVQFTVTTGILTAMQTPGHVAGYRCGVHVDAMRGNFAIFGNGVRILNPLAARIPRGTITIGLQPIVQGLVSPLGMAVPNDSTNRMFIHDQAGRAWVISNGVQLPTPFLDVRSRLVALNAAYDERGFLGLALHPSFATNRKLYTFTSEPVGPRADFSTSMPLGVPFNCQSVIAEWRVRATNPNVVDPATRRELMRIDKPQSNHNGGQLHFGPDGFLYVGLGDGGAGGDQGNGHSPDGNAQDINKIYGKMIRINVDGTNSANGKYGIPADNPFVGKAGLDEIFAYGLRNPFAWSFDTPTGRLYVGDVGQNDVEEVDIVTKGGNFGWRLKEGSFFFDPDAGSGFVTTVPVQPLPAGLINPIAQYDHDDGHAVIGGYVYRGATIPQLAGRLVFGDLASTFTTPSGRLFYLDASNKVLEFHNGGNDRPLGLWLKGFGQDRQGEIYVFASTQLGPAGTGGQMLRIVQLAAAADSRWLCYR